MNDEIMTVKQAAAYLKISQTHMRNLLAGLVPGCLPIPHTRAGRRLLVRQSRLDAWFRESERLSVAKEE
jgi:hypothetical protein